MSDRDDLLTTALAELPAPALSPAVSDRVLARARAHLAPASEAGAPARLVLAGALVPGLLATVVVDHVAETAIAVDQAFGSRKPPSAK